ncbi:unnamed protein product [Rotaria socialis]
MLGAQAIGRAFTRALRQELQYARTTAQSGKTSEKTVQTDRVHDVLIEKLNKQYEHLFYLNDKTKGGSFYLQSKIYRAKEHIDEELKVSSSSTKNSQRKKQTEDLNDTNTH